MAEDTSIGVIYRNRSNARIAAEDYDEAIRSLQDGKTQLDPDGDNCHVCGDGGHQAWECHHNPLVMARRAADARASDGTAIPWRCFHCGLLFEKEADAAEHFGADRHTPRPASCKGMLDAIYEQFEQYGLRRNQHNAASVRLLVELIRAESGPAVDYDAMCDRHWIAGAQFGWNVGCERDSESFTRAITARRRDLVEAAVEKAVRRDGIPLVRCECVDSNGIPCPDCTCDQGWRLPSNEKAKRRGCLGKQLAEARRKALLCAANHTRAKALAWLASGETLSFAAQLEGELRLRAESEVSQ